MTVRIAKIDRVSHLMVLKLDRNPLAFQLGLSSVKIFPVSAKGKVKHANTATRGRIRSILCWKQCDCRVAFANESRDFAPDIGITTLKAEDVDVPFRGLLNIAHAQRYVINSLELHLGW